MTNVPNGYQNNKKDSKYGRKLEAAWCLKLSWDCSEWIEYYEATLQQLP